jgi:hypothetical protein
MWAGNFLGARLVGPIELRPVAGLATKPQKPELEFSVGPFRVARVMVPGGGVAGATRPTAESEARVRARLQVTPVDFGRALPAVGGLLFAVSGLTLWLSAAGRYRWRVLGIAVFVMLLQFLVNVIGQLDESFGWMRPLTIFYYYRPQEMVLGKPAVVTLSEWYGGVPFAQIPTLAVLFGIGAIGYAMALLVFTRRDIPAPL